VVAAALEADERSPPGVFRPWWLSALTQAIERPEKTSIKEMGKYD
jgi:hypothetical protein